MTSWSILQVYKKGIKVVPRWDIIVIIQSIPCRCHRTTGDQQETQWAISSRINKKGFHSDFLSGLFYMRYLPKSVLPLLEIWILNCPRTREGSQSSTAEFAHGLVTAWDFVLVSIIIVFLYFSRMGYGFNIPHWPKLHFQIWASESCWMVLCSEHQQCNEIKSYWKHCILKLMYGKRTKNVISPVMCVSKKSLLYFR